MLNNKNSGVIPHNASFADALNEGKLMRWMSVNANSDKKDVNYPFIKEVDLVAKKLLELNRLGKGGK